jgi:hypothetical protein
VAQMAGCERGRTQAGRDGNGGGSVLLTGRDRAIVSRSGACRNAETFIRANTQSSSTTKIPHACASVKFH